MNFVAPNIAIGNFTDALDREGLAKSNIQGILCLNGDLESRKAEDLGVAELRVFTLRDGHDNDLECFEEAVRSVEEMSADQRLLVHCTEGRSRSVIVVAAHLARTQGMQLDDAIELIRENSPKIPPTDSLIAHWRLDMHGKPTSLP